LTLSVIAECQFYVVLEQIYMEWTEERKKKAQKNREETCLRKYGVRNPQQLKRVREKTSKTCEERYGGVGYAGTSGKKSGDTTEERYGKRNIMKSELGKSYFIGDKNPLKDPEARKKLSESLTGRPSKLKGRTYEEIHGPERAQQLKEERREAGAYGCSLAKRPSAPQLELFKLVKEVYPTAQLEYPTFGYCLDIAVPEKKLCFEYDGSYWHDPVKDKKRDKVLEKLGWKTTRFVDSLPTKVNTVLA